MNHPQWCLITVPKNNSDFLEKLCLLLGCVCAHKTAEASLYLIYSILSIFGAFIMPNICIVGGSNSSYSIISLLSQNKNNKIKLLTSRPLDWEKEIYCNMVNENNHVADTLKGTIILSSSEPKDVIPDAEIIIITAPVHSYTNYLQNIACYINHNAPVYLGFIYGQGGIDWMCQALVNEYHFENLHYWSVGLIPWICRTYTYGKKGINYGANKHNVVCASSDFCYQYLQEYLLDDLCLNYFEKGKFHRAFNFIELTLSVDNQIIHPARCYALAMTHPEGWANESEVPFFYKDFDDLSAATLQKVDNEYETIRQHIRTLISQPLTFLLGYLELERFSAGSEVEDIKKSFVESKTLHQIKPPLIKIKERYYINTNHRFFKDDIFYGLDIAKFFANQFSIETPEINKIRHFCVQEMLSQNTSFPERTHRIAIPTPHKIQN